MTNEAVRPKLNTPEIQTQGPVGGIILNIQREKMNPIGLVINFSKKVNISLFGIQTFDLKTIDANVFFKLLFSLKI